MQPTRPDTPALTRRRFLADCLGLGGGLGLGGLALAELAVANGESPGQLRGGPLAPRAPHHRARAKHVIYLHMSGAPPQHDTFDPKPKLQELDGTPCPKELFEGKRLAFIKGQTALLGSPHGFQRCGREGVLVGRLLPHMGSLLDEITLVRSMHTDQFNHAPAELLLFTGSPTFGGASMGSWVTWGLGSPNQDLPGYVVLISGESDPTGGKSLWGSGFLPSTHQGVQLRSVGEPILYASDPPGMDRDLRRRTLDALGNLNRWGHEALGDPQTLARIEQYELAFRMQAAVPGVMDVAGEPADVIEAYGAEPGKASFANNCLLARRLVEAGVRFVQLFDWGWDIHGTGPGDDLLTAFPKKCRDVDRPLAALIRDLKRRGLLDETLVVWGGEFGRTPMNEERNGSTYLGRDHHPDCFTIWLAGAGVHPGLVYGATDDLGYSVVEDPLSVRDLQATILYLLGFHPHRLRYPFMGLEQRLIGPEDAPRVCHDLFA